ncbi:MAG: alpha-amylase family glycosyl hydrolase [Streptomycetales bacterium]
MARGDWWRHGVVYQIYPRSFCDSDGDGVGDLPGITARLDHLNDGTPDSLGVDAIWLSPFYRSPMVDFGYDVSDHTAVDPLFGTLHDFDVLLAEAHRRGIRVIVDFVPNHTSDQHPWFAAARSRPDDPRRDWYVWADPRADGAPPNNWVSTFASADSAWSFDEATGQYYLHSYAPEQPDLNWRNPAVREAMYEVMRFWLDRGVDGLRVDAVHRIAKDPELGDNPTELADARRHRPHPTLRHHNMDWPDIDEFLREIREVLDGYDDALGVGEAVILDPAGLVRYYGEDGDGLHLPFHFGLLQTDWDAEALRATLDGYDGALPNGAWPNHTLSNHDTSRIVTRLGGGKRGLLRARAAAMLVLTLRGTPFLYYGDELGMADVPVPQEQAIDPDGRDPARSPMQWDASPGAGFTTGCPWLPLSADAQRRNAAAQRDDATSMLSLYRRLIWYRKNSPALRWGGYQAVPSAPPGVLAYLRSAPEERLLVALNTTDRPGVLTARIAEGAHVELSTDPARELGPVPGGAVELGPDEGLVIRA